MDVVWELAQSGPLWPTVAQRSEKTASSFLVWPNLARCGPLWPTQILVTIV